MYKRQEYKQCFGIYFPDFFCKLQTIHLRHFNVKYIQMIHFPIIYNTVSYTHLDVYKRQILQRERIVYVAGKRFPLKNAVFQRQIAACGAVFRNGEMCIRDSAYCIHEFDGEFVPFRDILTLCREAGNDGMVYEFASTSKVTLPGAGFSVMATSEANQAYLQKLIGIQTISYDKVNSLRHVRFLKDKAHTLELMKKHAAILNPKFQCVLRHLDTEIAPLGIASWQRPKGGYFVSVNTAPGLAKRTLALCKEAGVVMTGAGATFPYGRDPQDSNIRIAPSLPPVEELEQAMEIFCTSLRLAALEQRMQEVN